MARAERNILPRSEGARRVPAGPRRQVQEFRRYLLWRKVQRAMVAIGNGRTLTAAAYQAGFSDSAHLTRTFHQMFGLPPSVMMRGEFFMVNEPFGRA